jgi:alpha-maltose-1-phosphate synthase
MSRRLKVLLLAECANPDLSSASLIAWSLGVALRSQVDLHLVTQIRNREAIERVGWRDGGEFTAIDSDAVQRPVDRFCAQAQKWTGLGWTFATALANISNAYFERLAWRRFGPAIRAGDYDVVHRLTPVSPAVPSSMAARCRAAGVPFVWGPLNGGVPWPKEFRDRLRSEGEWLSYVRGAHRLMPGYRRTRRASAAILAGSQTVWDQLAQYHERCVYLPENAIDPERFSVARAPLPDSPLRVAFVGRLVPLKGVDMLIEAATPLVREGRVVLDIVGDGPQMPALRRQVAEAGIGHAVSLDGWIDHREVARRLSGAHVFGFLSIREFGGGAVLEAMALGVAPVVVAYAGPAELVTDRTGFLVKLGPRKQVVEGVRSILAQLASDPGRAREVGERARERVYRHFTWDVKARQMIEVYRWVLRLGPRPDFGMPFPDDP